MKVALTGHRPDKLGGYAPCPMQAWLLQQATQRLALLGPSEVFSGMALGWDQIGVEACIFLGIPFVAAIPFPGQELKWPAETQKRYHELLARAARVKIVSPAYERGAFQARNIWMVDQLADPGDTLLSCHDGTRGGTWNCISYAKASREVTGLPEIVVIDPSDFYFAGRT